MDDDALRRARELVDAARHVTVLTGAGISTDSGIPDFRGPDGIWTKNPAAERAANIGTYVSEPETRRAAWRHRAETAGVTREPNAGHRAIVDLERRGKLLLLVTQNVDGLHHAAGSDPDRVVEVHGNVREVKCLSCGERAAMERALERVRAGEADPPCRTCGGILKSATVSFGEALDPADIEAAERAARTCDLLLAVGTTLSVYPVAAMVPIARGAGARVAIVNAEPTDLDHLADVVVRGSISDVLPRLTGVGDS